LIVLARLAGFLSKNWGFLPVRSAVHLEKLRQKLAISKKYQLKIQHRFAV
jgi:hypothetical protein